MEMGNQIVEQLEMKMEEELNKDAEKRVVEAKSETKDISDETKKYLDKQDKAQQVPGSEEPVLKFSAKVLNEKENSPVVGTKPPKITLFENKASLLRKKVQGNH